MTRALKAPNLPQPGAAGARGAAGAAPPASEAAADSKRGREQQQQQDASPSSSSSSSTKGGRLIVPEAACTPDGREKRLWPSLTLSLLPHVDKLEELNRLAAFANSAAQLQRFAETPIEHVSAAAAALKLQQQQQQQQRKKAPAHWTLADGLRNICNG